MQVHKIVLTGGPCSGKSKVIAELKERLKNDGYNVIVVPETASELINAGILPDDNYKHTMMFQEIVLTHQLMKEKNAQIYADFIKNQKDIIILYDRGTLDNSAYLPNQDDFDCLLRKYNLSELELVDNYNLVINLVSLSSLKSDLYVNDEVRKEDLAFASKLDRKTSYSWLLAENVSVIKPRETIEEKIDVVHDLIISYVRKKGAVLEKIQKMDITGSDFKVFDNTNSKKLQVSEYTLSTPMDGYLDYKIYERDYKNRKSYILITLKKISDNNNLIINLQKIDQNTFLEILKQQIVCDTNNFIQIKYVDDNFNRFTLNYNNNEGVIKSYCDDSKIPSCVKLLK